MSNTGGPMILTKILQCNVPTTKTGSKTGSETGGETGSETGSNLEPEIIALVSPAKSYNLRSPPPGSLSRPLSCSLSCPTKMLQFNVPITMG